MLPRIVKTIAELEDVWRLTHDAYVLKGYCDPQPGGMLVHHRELDVMPNGELNPLTTVFYVTGRHRRMIGTCSFTLDSVLGLHCEETFPHEVDAVRDECREMGWLLGSSWRIETTQDVHRCVIGSLIDCVVQHALKFHVGVCLCTFNPRHGPFYQRFLGMKILAQKDTERGLLNAPTILMRFDRDGLAEWEENGLRFFCD